MFISYQCQLEDSELNVIVQIETNDESFALGVEFRKPSLEVLC